MSMANEYRQFANDCIVWAGIATSDDQRAHLLELAKNWRSDAERAHTPSGLTPDSAHCTPAHHLVRNGSDLTVPAAANARQMYPQCAAEFPDRRSLRPLPRSRFQPASALRASVDALG
jgi:hypothetical protein